MPEIAMQRVGPLSHIPSVLADLGISQQEVAKILGGSGDLLSNPDHLIPFFVVGELLERCAMAANCPHFGLLVGERSDHRALGMPGSLMANAATIGQALFDFVSCQFHNSNGAVVYLAKVEESALLGYGIYDRGTSGSDQIYDLALAVGVNALKRLGGPQARPAEVLLSRRAPEDRQPYLRVLGVTTRFNQPQSALVIPPTVLGLAVKGSKPAEYERLSRAIGAAIDRRYPDFRSRVQHILRPSLLMGTDSAQEIGRQLGIHVRTLNRRLREQGTTFRDLSQHVRFSVASELLEITDLQISDIAAALSYATPAAFDHAFQRWSGMPPSQWRATRVAAAAA